jgi:hypothetical protein
MLNGIAAVIIAFVIVITLINLGLIWHPSIEDAMFGE